jgi:hypothetical protein
VLTIETYVDLRLRFFEGKNIDLVGARMEKMVHDAGYIFRWLELDTKIAPEWRDGRVNVLVNKAHVITRITVG